MTKRIGLVGYGFIGRHVCEQILGDPSLGLAIAFVHNRSPGRLAGLPPELVLTDLGTFAERTPDLIVEVAHPAITRTYGTSFLKVCDYMPLSVTALADPDIERNLVTTALESNTRLIIPHGALVGLESLREARENWASVTITFRKPSGSLDFSAAGIDPDDIVGETVVYDGPARGIAAKFPRNVNTMITCGLATVGLDACRAILIADPASSVMSAEVEARGRDGAILRTYREEAATGGVSAAGMLASQIAAIRTAVGGATGLVFV